MKEHEQLKKICDKIWFKIYLIWDKMHTETVFWTSITKINRDVREIIFIPKFMEKYKEYAYKLDNIDNQDIYDLLLHLDNPVWYLYDLVFKK